MRSASDKDNIRMYSGLRKRRLTRIAASTRRFARIIVTANKMKNTMLTMTSGLRSSEESQFSADKRVAFVVLDLEVFENMVKRSTELQFWYELFLFFKVTQYVTAEVTSRSCS